MKHYFTEVRVSFGNTFTKIHETLSAHNYPLESLKSNFLSCYRYLEEQVSECNSIKDLMLNVVQKKCSLIDISILCFLVNLTGIAEAKQHVENYQKDVGAFCEKMNVRFALKESFPILPGGGHSSPLKVETIKVVVDWDNDEDDQHTLKDVKLLLADAFGRLSIHVKLHVINESNSIVIILLISYSSNWLAYC